MNTCIDQQRRRLAIEISRRTPVTAHAIYWALANGFSQEHIEAAIDAACASGVQPSLNLMAWLDRTETSVPTLAFPGLGSTVASAMEGAAAFARALQSYCADADPDTTGAPTGDAPQPDNELCECGAESRRPYLICAMCMKPVAP